MCVELSQQLSSLSVVGGGLQLLEQVLEGELSVSTSDVQQMLELGWEGLAVVEAVVNHEFSVLIGSFNTFEVFVLVCCKEVFFVNACFCSHFYFYIGYCGYLTRLFGWLPFLFC